MQHLYNHSRNKSIVFVYFFIIFLLHIKTSKESSKESSNKYYQRWQGKGNKERNKETKKDNKYKLVKDIKVFLKKKKKKIRIWSWIIQKSSRRWEAKLVKYTEKIIKWENKKKRLTIIKRNYFLFQLAR